MDDWAEHKQLVLAELADLKTALRSIDEKIYRLSQDVSALKARMILFGAAAGTLAGGLVAAIVKILV